MMATCVKRLVRSKSGLRIVALNEVVASPLMLNEPQWVPDNECEDCMTCHAKFDFFNRRHHCRRCGKCFCNNCCLTKFSLQRMCFVDPVRQCEACVVTSRKENDFFDKNLKTLLNGSPFLVTSSLLPSNQQGSYTGKLSSDHRFLQLEPHEDCSEIDAVELMQIESSKIMTSSTEPLGNNVAVGLNIKYKDIDGELQAVELKAPETPQRRQSMAWLSAMQKAVKMLYENKAGRTPPTTPSTPPAALGTSPT